MDRLSHMVSALDIEGFKEKLKRKGDGGKQPKLVLGRPSRDIYRDEKTRRF
jgi:hypothetical protein